MFGDILLPVPPPLSPPPSRSAGLGMLNNGELKEGIALVEKGLVHGPGNADLLDVLGKVFVFLFVCVWV